MVNRNTVLVDSMMLCLTNGERIKGCPFLCVCPCSRISRSLVFHLLLLCLVGFSVLCGSVSAFVRLAQAVSNRPLPSCGLFAQLFRLTTTIRLGACL